MNSQLQQDSIVSDILAVVKVLRKYSQEPLVKTILKEALESKTSGGNQPPEPADQTTAAADFTQVINQDGTYEE